MSLLDTIVDVFFNGNEDWETRVKSGLKLTSPTGQEFTSKYIRSTQAKEKNLAMYSKPFVSGSIVRDLGSKGLTYSIPLYFDGKDCDLVANAVLSALDEIGQWEIDHPVFGFYKLQPVSMSLDYNPILKGGIAVIESSWIEPLDETTLKTARQMAGIVDSLSQDLNTSVLSTILNNIEYGAQQFRDQSARMVQGIKNVTQFLLSPMAVSLDAVDTVFWSAAGSLDDLELATAFQIEQMVGQMQQLIQAPLFAKKDAFERFNTYNDLATEIGALLPGNAKSTLQSNDVSLSAKNHALIGEMALLAVLSAFGQIAITTPVKEIDSETGNLLGYNTRAQVLSFANTVTEAFDTLTDQLDTVQANTADNIYSEQYFSQSESYKDSYVLVYAIVEYLLSVSYKMSKEKRFRLPRPMTPLEVAVTQYKSFGEQDYYIDLFIASNNLEGDDLLLLSEGREVVIYV